MHSRSVSTILKYFVNLFRVQLNRAGNPCDYRRVERDERRNEVTYELRVLVGRGKDERWKTRRMTIGPLGDESGSKSRCYKVVYDDLLVVKIPPTPITDFSKYLEIIKAERQITERLSREVTCITPSVSAILRHHPDFQDLVVTEFSRIEEDCLRKLRLNPYYQNLLKLGDGYAFFMRLSQYSFLGHVISDMHDVRHRVKQEILEQEPMLGDPLAFERIYGARHGSVFFDLDDLYATYEKRLSTLLKTRAGYELPQYQKKQWLLTHLTGDTIHSADNGVPEEMVEEINRIIRRVIGEYASVVKAYWRAMAEHVLDRTRRQNYSRMSGIIANLLDLLARLKTHGIAMRDLKPDNVFIVADLSASPLVLADPKAFSIGLIDFETAMVLKYELGQPMLAGTPSYATPSHLFPNSVLSLAYADLHRIFRLQDWHAVTSMIFNVVTGRRLTQETGRLMPTIARDLQTATEKHQPKAELFEKYSRLFWRKGMEEFQKKLRKYEAQLSKVDIPLSEESREMLAAELHLLEADLEERLRRTVAGQKLFQSGAARKRLMGCSLAFIQQTKAQLTGPSAKKMTEKARGHINLVLDCVATLKSMQQQTGGFLMALNQEAPRLSSHELLRLLFSVVLYAMYRPEWGSPVSLALYPRADACQLSETFSEYEGEIEVEPTLSG